MPNILFALLKIESFTRECEALLEGLIEGVSKEKVGLQESTSCYSYDERYIKDRSMLKINH